MLRGTGDIMFGLRSWLCHVPNKGHPLLVCDKLNVMIRTLSCFIWEFIFCGRAVFSSVIHQSGSITIRAPCLCHSGRCLCPDGWCTILTIKWGRLFMSPRELHVFATFGDMCRSLCSCYHGSIVFISVGGLCCWPASSSVWFHLPWELDIHVSVVKHNVDLSSLTSIQRSRLCLWHMAIPLMLSLRHPCKDGFTYICVIMDIF